MTNNSDLVNQVGADIVSLMWDMLATVHNLPAGFDLVEGTLRITLLPEMGELAGPWTILVKKGE